MIEDLIDWQKTFTSTFIISSSILQCQKTIDPKLTEKYTFKIKSQALEHRISLFICRKKIDKWLDKWKLNWSLFEIYWPIKMRKRTLDAIDKPFKCFLARWRESNDMISIQRDYCSIHERPCLVSRPFIEWHSFEPLTNDTGETARTLALYIPLPHDQSLIEKEVVGPECWLLIPPGIDTTLAFISLVSGYIG